MNTRKYSNKYILKRVQQHCIDQLKSVHTLAHPCYNTIKARCETDPELKSKFQNLINTANGIWENLGIQALITNDREFNTPLYRTLVANKKPFLPYEVLELEDRITALEDRSNAND